MMKNSSLISRLKMMWIVVMGCYPMHAHFLMNPWSENKNQPSVFLCNVSSSAYQRLSQIKTFSPWGRFRIAQMVFKKVKKKLKEFRLPRLLVQESSSASESKRLQAAFRRQKYLLYFFILCIWTEVGFLLFFLFKGSVLDPRSPKSSFSFTLGAEDRKIALIEKAIEVNDAQALKQELEGIDNPLWIESENLLDSIIKYHRFSLLKLIVCSCKDYKGQEQVCRNLCLQSGVLKNAFIQALEIGDRRAAELLLKCDSEIIFQDYSNETFQSIIPKLFDLDDFQLFKTFFVNFLKLKQFTENWSTPATENKNFTAIVKIFIQNIIQRNQHHYFYFLYEALKKDVRRIGSERIVKECLSNVPFEFLLKAPNDFLVEFYKKEFFASNQRPLLYFMNVYKERISQKSAFNFSWFLEYALQKRDDPALPSLLKLLQKQYDSFPCAAQMEIAKTLLRYAPDNSCKNNCHLTAWLSDQQWIHLIFSLGLDIHLNREQIEMLFGYSVDNEMPKILNIIPREFQAYFDSEGLQTLALSNLNLTLPASVIEKKIRSHSAELSVQERVCAILRMQKNYQSHLLQIFQQRLLLIDRLLALKKSAPNQDHKKFKFLEAFQLDIFMKMFKVMRSHRSV